MRSASLALVGALASSLAPSTIPPVAKRISAAHVDKYRRDGVVVIRGVADAATVELLRRAVAACVANPGPYAEDLAPGGDSEPNYFTDLELSTRHATLRHFAETGAAAAVAARLMESRTATFLYDQLFVKHASNAYARNASTPWHADGSYWAVRGKQIASVAIALDDHDASDSLAFSVGSHLAEGDLAPVQFATGERYEAARDLPAAAAPSNAAQFELCAGDALVFDARCVHGGPGCFGRSLVLRFVGDDVVFDRPRFESGRCAIPTSDPLLADGAPLASSDEFPVCFVDPLFGAASTPVSVVEWSKGVAVSEEKGDYSAGTPVADDAAWHASAAAREAVRRVERGETTVLDLSGEDIAALPEALGDLEDLEELVLWRCSNLAALPESLGRLGNLRALDLSECSRLSALPASIGSLRALESLQLIFCSSLTTLPREIGELTACEVECVGTVNLVEPPRAVAEEGIAAIARYFDERRA